MRSLSDRQGVAVPNLADEALHLAGAFHLAGYQNVIGTLWPVDDDAAERIATDFHRRITCGGRIRPDTSTCAEALHHAVRALRTDDLGIRRYATHVDERPENPSIQISVGYGGAWIVGVPVPGTLASVDKALRDQGIETLGVSWRAPRGVRGEGDEAVEVEGDEAVEGDETVD